MAEAQQAKFNSAYQSATQRYISTLPIERQKELDAAVQEFDESDWQHIGKQVIANPDLAVDILGNRVEKKDWASKIVKVMKLRKKVAHEQKAKAKRDKPMTQAQQREYMRTYVKSQSSALYNSAWTRKQVWALPDDKLIQMYNRIKSRCAKDGMGASKNIPITLADAVSSINMDIPVAAEKVSLLDTSADVPHVAASSYVDKGKAHVIAEDPPSRKRTRKQMEEERLGEEAAKRLDEEQQDDLARFHEIKVREVELQAARAKQMRQAMDEQYASAALESSQDSTDEQFDNPSVETDAAEGVSTEAKVPDASSLPHAAIYVPGRRAKRMARVRTSHSTQSLIDVNASDASFIREGSPDDWPEATRDVLVHWELTENGQFNTIYRLDKTSISFTFLQEILHLVDHQDLVTLNDLVHKYYANHTPTGSGLYLLGDLRVLFDSSTPTGVSYDIWKNNQRWKV